MGVLALGDAGQGRARLALAAGADHQDLVPGEKPTSCSLMNSGRSVQIAALAGRLDHAQSERPTSTWRSFGDGGAGDGLQARHVGGKAADGHAALAALRSAPSAWRGRRPRSPPRLSTNTLVNRRPWPARRRRPGVAAPLVGVSPDHRVGIDLPVAGMQHGAELGAEHHGVRLGDRMGQCDQLELERADLELARQGDLGDRHLVLAGRLRSACGAGPRR